MKIVFLDIDGVIAHIGGKKEFNFLCEQSIFVLNLLLIHDVKVVISSSWRKLFSIDEIKLMFTKNGFAGTIIGVTPVCYGPNGGSYIDRSIEIQKWLDNNPDVTEFVILDDEEIGGLESNFIKVKNGWEKNGLQLSHIEKAKQILNINVSS